MTRTVLYYIAAAGFAVAAAASGIGEQWEASDMGRDRNRPQCTEGADVQALLLGAGRST